MQYVIKNKNNQGYYNRHTQGWTTLERCTKDTLATMQKLKDELERKPALFEQLQLLSMDDAIENVRY